MFIRKWFNTSFRLQLLHKFTFTAMGAIKYLYRNRLLIGKHDTKLKSDGWTVVTKDLSLSAQFEHTIGVTKDGYEIFTLSPKGLHFPPY